uniref:Reverse transcriptase Ty1/copia-type domain-containing protein n=1 Tax=Solanum tuberosum TaxID=4113 RepID=M1C2H1_SOLTU
MQNISNVREPDSYEEATMNHVWQAAMTQEFEALHTNHTWDLVHLPAGKKEIGCRWIYKIEHKADGSIERFKARLVVKRYTQQAGVDYTETFSPVVIMTTVRTLISVAVKRGWKLYQLDVNNAFLHGYLNEEVYMDAPQGLDTNSSHLVCKLRKYLYGLKQASRQWYDKLTQALESRGFAHSVEDYSLFYKKSDGSSIFLAVYVDDIVVTGTDLNEINNLK